MNGQGLIRFIKKTWIVILAIIMMGSIVSSFAIKAHASEVDTVRVGFFSFDGYHEIDENDRKSGYGYDFLTLMKRYSNVNFEYVGYDKSWNEMLTMLDRGEIDMVTSAHKTAERLEQYDFSMPIGSNTVHLNVREDENRFVIGNFKTYNGMTVGLLQGSSVNDKLVDFSRENGFTFTAVYYDEIEAMEKSLANKDIDAIATSSLRRVSGEKVLNEFASEYFYAIVKKGNSNLLNKINYAISQMDDAEGDWRNNLFYKNYDSVNFAEMNFSPEEKEYINKHSSEDSKIILAVDNSWAPFSYKDDDTYKGIIPEYIQVVMDLLGIQYEYLDYDTDIFDDKRLHSQEADIYFGYLQDAFVSEEKGYIESAPFLNIQACYLKRKDSNDLKTIAISAVNPRLNSFMDSSKGQKVLEYPRAQEAIEAVLNHKADAAYLYAYEGEYYLNRNTTGSLVYEFLPDITFSMCAIASENADHRLVSIVSKCINHISSRDISTMVSRNIAVANQDISMIGYFRMHPIQLGIVMAALSFLIITAVFVVLRMKEEFRHRKVLEEKMKEISCLNDKLEESACEQEAQIEEISSLNSELEERQAQLEEAASEQEAQLEEIKDLNTQMEKNHAIIDSTAQRYFIICAIDLENDQYEDIFALNSVRKRFSKTGKAHDSLMAAVHHMVYQEDRAVMKAFLDTYRWADYLAEKNIHSCEYRGVTSGWSKATLFATMRDELGKVKTVVFAAEQIHEQKNTEEKLIHANEESRRLHMLLRESQDHSIEELLNEVIRRENSEMISHLMEMVGCYFDADRAYVFETDETKTLTVNTFEWCAEGIHPEIDNLQEVPEEVVFPWYDEFKKNGCFYISCDDEYAEKEPMVYEVLEPQGIQSLMAAPMIVSGKIIGFIGVDNPKKNLEHKV